MRRDLENYCRFCSNYHCCSKCRLKHEKTKHNLKHDCDICIFGLMYFKRSIIEDDEILTHIKQSHLPLKCRRCNYCFYTISDIIERRCDQPSFKKCCAEEYRVSPQENKSTVISGTWNKMNVDQQRMRELSTSTPMGSGVHLARSTFDPAIVSPPISESSSVISSSRLSGVTPFNSSAVNFVSPPLPIITPLRSIISKGKTPGNENRRVTFSEPAGIVPKKYPFDMSPSTPMTDKSDTFYTPEGPSNFMDTPAGPIETRGIEECHNDFAVGIRNFFGSMAKVVSNAFKHVIDQITVDDDVSVSYTNTNGSVKRFLSPNADRTVPKMKKQCIRTDRSFR